MNKIKNGSNQQAEKAIEPRALNEKNYSPLPARKIFLRLALLLLVIIALCVAVYLRGKNEVKKEQAYFINPYLSVLS